MDDVFQTKSEEILHDIRNLLTVVNVTAWQIQQDLPSDPQGVEAALERQKEAVTKVTKLLEQLQYELDT